MTAETEPAPRILVVDDVAANVRLLEAIVEPAGFSLSSASSGPEALERVQTELPDLVLLDVQMAGMNGYEVCRRIRENEETALVPVVMVTSHDGEARIDGIRAGADDFVTKPFDQQELLLRVRSLVRIKRYHDTIRAQAAELAEWNRTLEGRVAEQVEELERMARLRRFLSPTLAEIVMTRGDSVLESHRRELAVLFADLRGWTDFSVGTEPEEVMSVVGSYHQAMGELIRSYEATVGWFAGDGLMVWFNDPIACDEPAARAVRMAFEMREAMTALTSAWRKRGHDLDFSIGVGLGYATIGRIGFEGRYDYGAVGSVLNLASRLCDAVEPGRIVVSRRVLAEVEQIVEAEPLGRLELKGFSRQVEAFAVSEAEGLSRRESSTR
jgi:adenylate cyclase